MIQVDARRWRATWHQSSYAFTPLLLLGVLLVVAAIRGPKLFTLDGLSVNLAVAAPLILATMALTPIALAGRGGVDLSVGPLMSFINVCIIVWLVGNGADAWYEVLPFALGIGVGAGLVQGFFVAVVRLQPLVVTLCGFLVFGGLALVVSPDAGGNAPGWLDELRARSGGVPNALLVLLSAFALWFAVTRTAFFRNIRMIGGDERAAFASGVPFVRTRVGAYVLAGVFAAAAAVMVTALLGSGDPRQGTNYTLTSIAALALGGTSLAGGRGGMLGSVAGALDVYLINYILGTYDFGIVSAYVIQVSYGAILVGSLTLGVVAARYSEPLVRLVTSTGTGRIW